MKNLSSLTIDCIQLLALVAVAFCLFAFASCSPQTGCYDFGYRDTPYQIEHVNPDINIVNNNHC